MGPKVLTGTKAQGTLWYMVGAGLLVGVLYPLVITLFITPESTAAAIGLALFAPLLARTRRRSDSSRLTVFSSRSAWISASRFSR